MLINVNHARNRSWNQPVLRDEGRVSCSIKQWEPLMGLDSRLTSIHRLRVRGTTHCATPPYGSLFWFNAFNAFNTWKYSDTLATEHPRNENVYVHVTLITCDLIFLVHQNMLFCFRMQPGRESSKSLLWNVLHFIM